MNPDIIYPRTGDTQTVYLKSLITKPTIEVGDFTIYNDFVNNPCDFEKNNVLYHLLGLKWWNWPSEKIKNHIAAIQSGNIDELLNI